MKSEDDPDLKRIQRILEEQGDPLSVQVLRQDDEGRARFRFPKSREVHWHRLSVMRDQIPVGFRSAAEYFEVRQAAFSGVAVSFSGELSSVTKAETTTEAGRRADEHYFHAVLEATKSIADKLQTKSGLSDDGAKLVDATLCGSSPRMAINDLLTESLRSGQNRH